MTKRRFTPWVALACIGTLAACTSSEEGPAGNTELNVIVPTNSGTPDEIDVQQVEYTIACAGNDDTFLDNNASFADQVRIDGNLEVVDGRTSYNAGAACVGGDFPGATCVGDYECVGGDNPGALCSTPASPSLECQGTSPTLDGSCVKSCQGTSPTLDGTCETIADFGANQGANDPLPGNRSEVWQGFMDLPPGPCNLQLRARDNKGEVICTTDEPFFITADVTVKVNVLLICQTAFQAPVGSLDVDATFSFNVGNFCPDLFVFNASTSDPLEVTDVGLGFPVAATTLQARYRDGDKGCHQGCDPQMCSPSPIGLSCSPATDPGLSTMIKCTSEPPNSFQIDCFGGTPSGSDGYLGGPSACTLAGPGDNLGILPEFLEGVVPNTPIACPDDDPDATPPVVGDDVCAVALGADPGTFPGSCRDNFCDYSAYSVLLNADMGVAFFPPRGAPLFGPSGTVITCEAWTTDGDVDCDKHKMLTLQGPGDSPCEELCGIGNTQDCDACDDTGSAPGVGQCTGQVCTGDAECGNPPVENGIICTDADSPSGNGICTDGVCISADCNATGCPEDGNACTQGQTCDEELGECLPDPPDPEPAGTQCDATDGTPPAPLSGQCDGATAAEPACVDNCSITNCSDGEQCTKDLCDPEKNDGAVCPSSSTGTDCCSNPPEPSGTPCDVNTTGDGACDGAGECVLTVDYPEALETITLACSNNVTSDTSILPFDLTVDPAPLAAGSRFDAAIGGDGQFSESFLDVAQTVVPCGARSGQVLNLAATVQVRSGAELAATCNGGDEDGEFCELGTVGDAFCAPNGGTCDQLPPVVLGADNAQLDTRCSVTGAPCTGAPNQGDCFVIPSLTNLCSFGFADIPDIDGIVLNDRCNADSDTPDAICTVDTDCDADCVDLQDPDCNPGVGWCADGCGQDLSPAAGTCLIPPATVPDCNCDACAAFDPVGCVPFDVNDPCTKGDQCRLNGFCITSGLPIPLTSEVGTYVAGTVSGTDMLFGWDDGGNPTNPDGSTMIPPSNADIEPIGMDVSASGLGVQLRCLMSVDSGGVDGVAECVGGASDGLACVSRAETPRLDDFCLDGDRAGDPCEPNATDPDEPCPGASCLGDGEFGCGCVNVTCGVLAAPDDDTGADCTPSDKGSPTPDANLIAFPVP